MKHMFTFATNRSPKNANAWAICFNSLQSEKNECVSESTLFPKCISVVKVLIKDTAETLRYSKGKVFEY